MTIEWASCPILIPCTSRGITTAGEQPGKNIFGIDVLHLYQMIKISTTVSFHLKQFEIPMGSWEQTAQERSKWRGLINKGAALYEKKRICEAERKRRERKAKTNVPPTDSMTLTCSTCNRQFRARIGLVSHQRTHQHTSALFKK